MMDSKLMEKSYLSIGAFSPPLSGSSRSSPPVDIKFKHRHENRNTVSFAGDKVINDWNKKFASNLMRHNFLDPNTRSKFNRCQIIEKQKW